MDAEPRPPWQTEIIELHDFFEELFFGNTTSLDRAAAALADDFTMAGPYGAVTSRDQVMAQLESGIGHTSELAISVEGLQLILETEDVVVAEYVEVHSLRDDRSNQRRSTVVFRRDPDGPNGLRWVRVQETWIEPTD
jgi:hypothetical protein